MQIEWKQLLSKKLSAEQTSISLLKLLPLSSLEVSSPSFCLAVPYGRKIRDMRVLIMKYTEVAKDETATEDDLKKKQESLQKIMANESAVITTSSVTVPSLLNVDNSQIVRFGTSLDFKSPDRDLDPSSSSVILPCIFGTPMQGPLMLATGRVSSNAPFANDTAIREYFQQLKEIVFIVDDRMTDNARNLATSYRINALFVIQLPPPAEAPKDSDAVLSLLNAANINAVTALAGPQSLILVQIGDKYYFYRGIANREHLNTSSVVFGTDITSTIQTTGLRSLVDPRAKRIIDLEETNAILMPTTGQLVKHTELKEMFENLPIDKINGLEEDISAIVPQLQVLLNQKDLSELSKTLVSAISGKVSSVTAPLRKEYIHYLTKELKRGDPESEKKKSVMLGELRKTTKDLQKQLEPAISSLANMMSSQTTSKRTHDLQKLVRQAAINTNVETAKTMNFETMAGFLEEYAGEMGVMLVNIQTEPFRSLLGNLKNAAIDATPACELDSRMIHLPGLDAGLIMEQSQNEHYGPLKSTSGPDHPTLGLPYLSPGQGHGGSMLAWVCWDEFVNLESPYSVRWMEKCNEGHIAVLRIIMRDTLSQAITSREHNMQSGSLETGHLMSAMLMAAMKKLAAMRTTIPKVIGKAEDTVTLLMRGLFGNLLTIAGSGVQPLSMVWQLFGLNPAYDIPKTEVDWVWYETVVALYPYTGWKRERFYENLEKLLDKAIVRVVTKNEDAAQMKSSQADDLIKFCKLRNIQLDHSRTIITAFMRMLTMEGADVKAIAGRLLEHIPNRLDKQSQSYTKMIKYLQHLATGGERRIPDDVVAAGVYHKRSAAFSDLKTKIREASVASDWPKVKELCQQLLKEHEDVAKLWHIPVDSFHIQNIKLYQSLRQADFTTEDQTEKVKNFALTRQVLGDAETRRTPWQVGKPGQYSDEIEPLNEGFLHELLTGEEAGAIEAGQDTITGGTSDAVVSVVKEKDPFEEYESSLSPSFIQDLQKDLTAAQVCQIMKVPETAMRVFAHALSPDFEFSQLNTTFKLVILGLLRNRSNRLESEPVKKLFEITRKEPRMLEQGGAGGSPMQTD